MSDAAKKPRKKVRQLDYSKPIFLAIDQTPTSTNVELFEGNQAGAEAYAAGKSLRLGRQVALFGPQYKVKGVRPATVEDVDLSFIPGEGE